MTKCASASIFPCVLIVKKLIKCILSIEVSNLWDRQNHDCYVNSLDTEINY